MATISAFESITADGVMQGVGRPDEDTRGGFDHGGWGDGYGDHVIGEFIANGMADTTAMLLGHRTYTDLLGHWTSVTEPNPYTDMLVKARKYVVSRDSGTDLTYPNSTLLAGDATETVAQLLGEIDGVLTIIGSGQLVRSLHAVGLVQEYQLLIHPIVLGSGTRLFGDGAPTELKLTESATSTTGVVLARYQVG